MADLAIGRNQVEEALRANTAEKVLVARGTKGAAIREIRSDARGAGVPVRDVDRREVNGMADGLRHQGVIAILARVGYVSVDDILKHARSLGEDPFIALLDGLQDPRNLGAVLRSAEAAGVHGVVLTTRKSVGLTEAAFRTSAGAAAHIRVARVTSLKNTLEKLKKARVWIAGADQEGDQSLHEADLAGPVGIVIGGEGKGLRRLVREHCDFTVRIPMAGKINSLNASGAGALIFFEVRRRRDGD